MHKTTRALVLREVKYKEADKILTVLTEDEGKLTVSARGVMRRGSKLAAACQLFAFSELTLFENRGKWYADEGQTVEQFLGLRSDIAKLALAAYFAELLETVSDEDSPNPEVLRLGLNSLYALSEDLYPPEHIKAVFELRLMCLAGFEPSLDCCPVCGCEVNALTVFSVHGGSLLCLKCKNIEYGETRPLCRASLQAMEHVVNAEGKRIFSFSLDAEAQQRFSRICEDYVGAQLDRRFHALNYWNSVKD